MMRKLLLGWALLMLGAASLGLIALAQVARAYPDQPHQPSTVSVAPSQEAWVQSNDDGFGDSANGAVLSLALFGTNLYAGTLNMSTGAEIWRLESTGWEMVMTGGFGDMDNVGIDHLAVFAGVLYAGTVNLEDGGEIWRTDDGSHWIRVFSAGGPYTPEVFRFVVFWDTIYAGTWSADPFGGAEIWRSDTGDADDWQRVIGIGFGNPSNEAVLSLETFGDGLYAGTYNQTTGGEIWRSSNGTSWSQVNSDGFGDPENVAISSLAEFGGYLYAGVAGNETTGAQLWRSPDGTTWVQVESSGFGNVGKGGLNALHVYDGQIHFVVGNEVDGLSVWRSSTGNTGDWAQVVAGGFGDSNNQDPHWDNSTTEFDNSLFLGTVNSATGGEVWRVCEPVYGAAFTWSPPVVVAGTPVDFSAVVSGTAPFTYTWDFGDGYGDAGMDVSHTFDAAGSYIVELTAENACGTDAVTDTLTVEAEPHLVYLPIVAQNR